MIRQIVQIRMMSIQNELGLKEKNHFKKVRPLDEA